MADFLMRLKSHDGLLQQVIFPRATDIPLGDNDNSFPSTSDTEFVTWQCGGWKQNPAAAFQQWTEYYSQDGLLVPSMIDVSTLSAYLRANNYVTEADACDLCVFKLLDENGQIIINKQYCLRAFCFQNDTTVRYYLAARTEFNGVWTYTTKSSIEPMSETNGESAIRVVAGVISATNGGDPIYAFGIIGTGDDRRRYGGYLLLGTDATLQTQFGGNPEEEEDSPEYGPGSEPGGYGPGGGGSGGPDPTFDGTSDPWIDYPQKPGIAALGLVNLYKCDVGSLVNLGAELFPDINFPTSLSDVGEVIAAVSDSIWNSKLIDYIVSAHIIPIDVDVTGVNLEDIKVGTRTMTGILARKISNDIVEFDCGSVHIDEYYTNFVDYRGTRCKIYIPLYGMIELKPEYWQSATLSLKYLFNVVDGSFIAQLFSEVMRHQAPFKAMIGQYTGCACVHVPMTGAEYASMFGGMIANAGGMVSGIATANPAMAATAAVGFAQSTAGGGAQGSNAYNASAGFYGYPRPYLIIERQVSHFSTRYPQEKGLPLLVSKRIGDCSGFTVAEDIILDGIACTSDEKERIRNYFKSGVIIRN